MQPRSPGSPTATCGMHACDNCAEQHRHAPSRTRRSRVRVGGASPDHHWRSAARGVPDLGWVRSTSRCTSKLLRALLRRSGSHRMITIGSLSSFPSSSARKPARTLPIRTRVTTTTMTAAPPRIPTAANDAWRLYGRAISRLPVLPVRAPPPFALPGDICKRPGVFTRKKRTGPDFAGLPPG